MNLSISPGKNNVGAYINDINLKSLDQEQATEIKKILNQYGVIFIKEQNLDPETYQNFAKTIGQPVVYPRLKGLDEKFPFINVIERKPDDKNLSFGSSWLHQDTSYLANDRPRYTMLMGMEIPVNQGNTIFSSGFNAYDKLPDDIKKEIQNKKITLGYKTGSYSPSKFFKEHHHTNKPFNLVHTNDAGLTGLYFPFLQVFGGLEKELFEKLKNHILKDEFVYHHDWKDGDVVISEQWLSIHKRWAFNKMDKRILHRIGLDYSKCLH